MTGALLEWAHGDVVLPPGYASSAGISMHMSGTEEGRSRSILGQASAIPKSTKNRQGCGQWEYSAAKSLDLSCWPSLPSLEIASILRKCGR